MTARKTQAEKDAAAAAIASPGPDAIPVPEPDPNVIPVHKSGERQPDTYGVADIDLTGQRAMLDELARTLAGAVAADIGRAIDEARAQAGLRADLEPSVYLLHPVKGHVVHITVTQAIADGALGWADATYADIRRAGLTR